MCSIYHIKRWRPSKKLVFSLQILPKHKHNFACEKIKKMKMNQFLFLALTQLTWWHDCYAAANCVPLLIQQNIDGSDFFNRSWEEFKVGFNDTSGNYWLGNELLSQLTLSSHYRLRFDIQVSANLSWYYAEYSSFVVHGESRNYELLVSGYSGNAGDAFHYHNRMKFTTYDRDNDPSINSNCALYNGGWWHRTCSLSNINGVRGRGANFSWRSVEKGNLMLHASRMWLMC